MSITRAAVAGSAVLSFVLGAVALHDLARADAVPPSAGYDVVERPIAGLHADLLAGRVTSEALTRAYLARIDAMDARGPALHSIIALDPHALDEARRADRDRAAGVRRGMLAGIPVLVKDNIETADGSATTAGSDALAANVARRDAPLVARLRAAGAVILGKTNLSEWANFRSSASISGWSARGGLVKNAYALDRSACGSSSGTGAAIAASLAAAGVGTETDGSVTCPSSIDGLVGLKPTVGLISRTGVVPISSHQDTPGPMGRSVADVAALLSVLAGSDPKDPATLEADAHVRAYASGLAGATLAGKRLGIADYAAPAAGSPQAAVFARAVALLRSHGATIVHVADFKPNPALGDAEFEVLLDEFKTGVNAYLATTPAAVRSRTLARLIGFDRADARELGLFGQDVFERAETTGGPRDPKYVRALAACARYARAEGLDLVMNRYRLDALVAPTAGPASRIDVVDGDNYSGTIGSLPAIAGYPHLTVPMGSIRGLPVGLSFVGRKWSEAALLGLGAAYERASHARRAPQYLPSVEGGASVSRLLGPPERSSSPSP